MTTPIPTPLTKKKKLVYVVLLSVLVAVVFIVVILIMWGKIKSRLSVGSAFGGAGFTDAPVRTHYSVYDIQPQVIYRLDDNRYVEIKNYAGCQPTPEDTWVAEAWYYDIERDIRTKISHQVRNYQGRFINADPTGKNLVLPTARDRLSCSDKGCGESSVAYSTDYGKTFKYLDYTLYTSSTPSEDSKIFTIVITEKELMVYEKGGGVIL